jgi:hypothetical protein
MMITFVGVSAVTLVIVTSAYMYVMLRKPTPKSTTTPLTKREKVMLELLKTERSYVKGLRHLRTYFIVPLKLQTPEGVEERQQQCIKQYTLAKAKYNNMNSFLRIFSNVSEPQLEIVPEPTETLLSAQQIKEFFEPIQVIIGVNELFLHDLEEIFTAPSTIPLAHRWWYWVPNPNRFYKEDLLAKLLLSFSHAFKLYSSFIGKHTRIMANLKLEKQKESIKEFFIQQSKLIQAENKNQTEAHQIDDFMIGPIQRVCRYKMLIDEIIKSMKDEKTTDSRDAATIKKMQQASVELGEIAHYCNQKTHEMENLERVVVISKNLKLPELIEPHRILVKENKKPLKCVLPAQESEKGYWNSITSIISGTKPVDCYFYLFNDMMVLERKLDARESMVDPLLLKLYFDIPTIRVVSKEMVNSPASPSTLRTKSATKHAFTIFKDEIERVTIICDDEQQQRDWIHKLNNL